MFRECGSRNIRRSIDNSWNFHSIIEPFAERYIYIDRNGTQRWLVIYVPFQSGWESRFRKVSLMNIGGVGFHDAEAKIRDLNSSIDSRARRSPTRTARNTRVYTPLKRRRSFIGLGHAPLHPCPSFTATGMLTFPPLPYRSGISYFLFLLCQRTTRYNEFRVTN